MLRPAIFIIFIQCCSLCHAQTDSVSCVHRPYINLKLSSSSSVIYPGISAGIEFRIHRIKDKNLITKSSRRSYFKQRFVAGNLSWYHHPEFHDNIYFAAEYVMRRTRTSGFISEFSFGSGFSRTFLSGTTYTVNNNRDISISKECRIQLCAHYSGWWFRV